MDQHFGLLVQESLIHVDSAASDNSLAGLRTEVSIDIQARPVDPVGRDSSVHGCMLYLDLSEGLSLL